MSNIRYASFMLRLQLTQNDDSPLWIVSMESTKTGELRWFPNLEGAIQFLRDEYGNCNLVSDTVQTFLPDTEIEIFEKTAPDSGINDTGVEL